MGGKKVVVIAKNLETGEETRYLTYAAAARDLGGVPSRILRSCLNDYPYLGHSFRREDDWILEKGKKNDG